MNKTQQSVVNPKITINYCLKSLNNADGWCLSIGEKIDSPLALIPDEIERQKIMAEANDIVWPENKFKINVVFDDGNVVQTGVNGSRLSICNHYLGNVFVFSGEVKARAVRIVFYPASHFPVEKDGWF